VTPGTPLLTLHTDTPERIPYALEALDGAIATAATFQPRPLLLDRIAVP
jgi:thymidine phosphorylase